jgi:hypothetical protein
MGDWLQHYEERRMGSVGNIGVTREGKGKGLVSLGLKHKRWRAVGGGGGRLSGVGTGLWGVVGGWTG